MSNTPDKTKLDIPVCKEILAESKAKTYRSQEVTMVPLRDDGEVKRCWTESVTDRYTDLLDFLTIFTSAKNTAPQYWVDDPLIDGEKLLGKWRGAYNVAVVEQPYPDAPKKLVIVQTLRRGYITQLVTGTSIDWSEARLVNVFDAVGNATSGSDNPEQYVVVEWRGVCPKLSRSIINTFPDTSDLTVYIPEIKGEKIGTGYYKLHAEDKIEEDGSATITLYLANPRFSITSYTGWLTERSTDVTYHWNVPKTLAQTVVEGAKAKGVSVQCSYQQGQALVDIIIYARNSVSASLETQKNAEACYYSQYVSYYWGYAEALIPPLPAKAVGKYYTRQLSRNDDGTYDAVISWTESTEDAEELVWTDARGLHKVWSYYNTPDDAQTKVNALIAAARITAAYQISPSQSAPHEDCTFDVVIQAFLPQISGVSWTIPDHYHFTVYGGDRTETEFEVWIEYTADGAAKSNWLNRTGAALVYYNAEGFVATSWRIVEGVHGHVTGEEQYGFLWRVTRVEQVIKPSAI